MASAASVGSLNARHEPRGFRKKASGKSGVNTDEQITVEQKLAVSHDTLPEHLLGMSRGALRILLM